jgi:hypothetical protein
MGAARAEREASEATEIYGKTGGAWVGNDGFTLTDQTTGETFVGENSHTKSKTGSYLRDKACEDWTTFLDDPALGEEACCLSHALG